MVIVTGLYQPGSSSLSRRWISAWSGTLGRELPEPKSIALPSALPSRPKPEQQNRMPPTIQVVMRDPLRPRLLKTARTVQAGRQQHADDHRDDQRDGGDGVAGALRPRCRRTPR